MLFFFFCFCFVFKVIAFVLCSFIKSQYSVEPALYRCFCIGGAGLLNTFSFFEFVLMRLLIPLGRFLMIAGGWLLCLLMYDKLLFCFRYGLNRLFLRSRVTSRKSFDFLFAWMVIFNPLCWNILLISCFIVSTCFGGRLQVARLLSLYRPTFMSRCINRDSK